MFSGQVVHTDEQTRMDVLGPCRSWSRNVCGVCQYFGQRTIHQRRIIATAGLYIRRHFVFVECSLSVVVADRRSKSCTSELRTSLSVGAGLGAALAPPCPNFWIVRICHNDTEYSAATRHDQRQLDNKPVDHIPKTSKWVIQQVSEPVRAMRSAVISRRRCAATIPASD